MIRNILLLGFWCGFSFSLRAQTAAHNNYLAFPEGGFFRYSVEELPKAEEQLSIFLDNAKAEAVQMFRITPEKSYGVFWEAMSRITEWVRIMALYYSQDHPSFSGLAYDCTLLSKSIFLYSSRYRDHTVNESVNPALIAAWKNLKRDRVHFENDLAFAEFTENLYIDSIYRARLAILQQMSPEQYESIKTQENTWRAYYDPVVYSWKEHATREQELLSLLEKEGVSDIDLNVSWTDVRNVLTEKEVAIEIISVDGNSSSDPRTSRQYMALLVRCDSPAPQLVHLLREHTDTVYNAFGLSDLEDLSAWVWKTLKPHLADVEHIYMAPSGMLHAISFVGIKDPDFGYVTDRFVIHNLLTTRDIIEKKKKHRSLLSDTPGRALFIGGADFDLYETELSRVDAEKVSAETHTVRAIPEEMRAQGLDYLPGAVKEVCKGADKLAEFAWKTSLFVDRYATKKQLLTAIDSLSPEVLHISTHGYYFPPLSKTNKLPVGFFERYSVMESVFRSATNPLMRCGLFFAGANRIWAHGERSDKPDSGILPGYEVSQLDLSRVRLVILSACSTGVGDIDQYEGVFGLQRAFRLAGVENMLVSRWKIPDKETEELISMFYHFWIPGTTVKEAFDRAQRTMRDKYPEEPYKWAGFVLIE